MRLSWNNIVLVTAAQAIWLAAMGCHRDMYDQPRLEPLETNTFFDDGRASRPLVEGTVAYQAAWAGDGYHTGRDGEELLTEIPATVDAALLRRGQERFNIFCGNCHGRTGDGDGMIVQRGYRQPPTFHSERLRGAPAGHFFDVITHGFGAMPSYAMLVSVDDRWAITAYVRALQWSQYATPEDLTDEQRKQLEAASAP